MSKSLQNAEQKILDIVQAAENLFLQQGFGVSSMDQVAQAAGVTKQTVYRYFASKKDLFGAVMLRIQTAETAPHHFGNGDIADELYGYANYLLGFHLQERALGLYRILLTEAAREDLLDTFKSQGPQRVLQPLIEYLGQKTSLDDPVFCAQMFATMILAPRNQLLMGTAQSMKKSAQKEHVLKVTGLFMKMIQP